MYYIYYRNLSVKIQLVEFKEEVSLAQLFSCPYEILQSIYNTTYITGPSFLTEAFTRVSYHTKNPNVNDEFKIRLPNVLSIKHWLKFTVMHLHVKPTAQRASILGKMMSNTVDVLDKTSTEIGIGYLQLLPNNDNVIEDKEHIVRVYGVDDTTSSSNSGSISSNINANSSNNVLNEKPSMHNMSTTSSLSEGKHMPMICLFYTIMCL